MKEDSPKRSKTKLTEQDLFDHLADCVLSVLKQNTEIESEPFEAYSHQLKVRFHGKSKDFREKFVKGYDVLMAEMQASEHQHLDE